MRPTALTQQKRNRVFVYDVNLNVLNKDSSPL